ncbi:phage/plasmid primase, P4 family [Streptomyces tauricus]|uniref:Phage/plasmid primase, P4 family n=1 Tax=Streptomyces tauricus TaxID=68274 RepID=A0ABZ1JF39_9ACTN|nr:phage/plasmid primase, P4 family [Streptomyces tauricus]
MSNHLRLKLAGHDEISKGRKVMLIGSDKIPLPNCKDCRNKSDAAHREVCECLKNGGVCHGFYAATDNPEVWEQQMTAHPDVASIGQATGRPSGIFVLEYDPKNGGTASYRKLVAEHGEFETLTDKSPSGGEHFVFLCPDDMVVDSYAGKGALWPGIDIKGERGYRLIPPSQPNPNKPAYSRVVDMAPQPAPGWLLEAIRNKVAEKAKNTRPASAFREFDPDSIPAEVEGKARKLVEKQLRKVVEAPDGEQNDQIFSSGIVLGSLVAAGLMDHEDARSLLEKAATDGNHPAGRTFHALNSAFLRAYANPFSVDDLLGLDRPYVNGKFTRPFTWDGLGLTERVLAKHGDEIVYIEETGQWAAFYSRDNLWKAEKEKSDALHGHVTDTLWNLEDTEGHLYTDAEVHENFSKFAREGRFNRSTNEALNNLGPDIVTPNGFTPNRKSLRSFDWNYNLICFRNGAVDVSQSKPALRPYKPNDYVTLFMPFAYDPEAKCPEFEAFLKRAQPDAKVRRYIQKAYGATLLGQPANKAFLHTGPPDSGKSLVPDVISALMGSKLATNISHSILCSDQPPNMERLSAFYKKRMIYADDIEGRLNSALVKKIATGEQETGRFLREDSFGFSYIAKLHMTANKLPQVPNDPGVKRRLVHITWDHAANPDDKQGLKQRLGNVRDYLIRVEGPGILNWLLEGAMRFVRDGGFEDSEDNLDAPDSIRMATYQLYTTDPLSQFIADTCKTTYVSTDRVSTIDLYTRYLSFMFGKEETTLDGTAFNKAITKRWGLVKKSGRVDGKNVQAFHGLKLRTEG